MRLLAASLLLIPLLVVPVVAQSQQTGFQPRRGSAEQSTATNVSRDLLAIYEQTKSARSESEVTAIARACSQVIPDRGRSEVDRDYASSLLAWALNRRGEIRNEKAAELVERGELDAADDLDRLANEDFATAIQYGPPNWRTHHNYAISLAMKGAYTRAIGQFDRALELNPDYANSHFNRGELYFELNKYDQAIADYSRAIELNPKDPQFYNSRGHCRFMLEAHEEALSDYRQAAEIGKDSVVYQTDLADAYQYLGRWEQAATAYRAAVAINNQYQRAYQNASWLMSTCPEEKFFNADLALSAAKKAMDLSREPSPQMLDTLAAATAAQGKYADAAKLLRQAIESAAAEERAELAQRLALYERGTPYRQPQPMTAVASSGNRAPSAASIRTASGIRR